MERIAGLLNQMASPSRLVKRDFLIGSVCACLVFNPDVTDEIVVRTTLNSLLNFDFSALKQEPLGLEQIEKQMLFASEVCVKTHTQDDEVLASALGGDIALFVDGIEGHILISAKKWDKRAVSEPPVETVQKGPREGFIEDIKTNLSLINRRLTTPALAIERLKIGRISQTDVALCYISTVAKPELVNLIRKKLKSIDVDALIDSHYLVPLIVPHPNSILNQVGTTEKPDVVCAKMLEGRVAIIVDGSPVVLTAPFLLIEDLQTAEDYYANSAFSTFLRILRIAAVLLSVFLPGGYVAMQVFHYNIIPVKFLVTLMNSVKGIPLTPLTEILFVLLLFEIIREASLRMPRAVGMAMSIVGGLVLGETAVKSGMISSPAVMIVALSSIALYTTPNEVGAIGLMRIAYTFLGGVAGLYGLVIGVAFTLIVLVNFDSFGSPYLAPFAPLVFPDLKDTVLMSNTNNHKRRPFSIPNINNTRQK